jgi:hypothetical protein
MTALRGDTSFRYLKQFFLVSPGHIPNIIDLSRKTKMLWPREEKIFKKQLFDPEVKGQGPTKVITECDTPPYGHAPHTKYH